jgi:hypothetical protein
MANVYILTRRDNTGQEWPPLPFTGSAKAVAYVAGTDPADLRTVYSTYEDHSRPAPRQDAQEEDYNYREIANKLMNGFTVTGLVGDLSFRLYKAQMNALPGSNQIMY